MDIVISCDVRRWKEGYHGDTQKGIVSKEMFEIPTVDSGAVNFVFVLVLKQNQHFL